MTNLEVIKNYYKSFSEDNIDGMVALVSDELHHYITEGPLEIGADKFRKYMEKMDRHFDEQVINLEIFAGQSLNRWSAEFKISGIYRKTWQGLPEAKGQKYLLPVGSFFDIQNSKISRITTYYNISEFVKQLNK